MLVNKWTCRKKLPKGKNITTDLSKMEKVRHLTPALSQGEGESEA